MGDEPFRMLGKSGFRVRVVGPGQLAQILPASALDRKLHSQLRSIPAFLLVPTAVWHLKKGKLRLCGVECVELFAFGLRGEEGITEAGWRQVLACALSKARPLKMPRALGARNNKAIAELLGAQCPGLERMRGAKEHPTLGPISRSTGRCCVNRCKREPTQQGAFCAEHLVERAPSQVSFDQITRKALGTPQTSAQLHKWLVEPYTTDSIGMLTAAALYFEAEHAHIEMIKRLGRYLVSGLGIDEMIVVAAGVRPVNAHEAGRWARVFGSLGRHAELHARNAANLINTTDRLTRAHKQRVAGDIAVYGISHEHFEPNPVSSVAPKLHGAWDYADAAQLGSFADGAIVKLPQNAGVALYTAVYAAAVLTDKMPHTFTWSVLDLTQEPQKRREFKHTFDGWGFGRHDLAAFDTLGPSDEVLVRNAGMLSWSALFRLITLCKATVVFHASVHFAKVAVYCGVIGRHVGGPFALLYHAATMTGRIDKRHTQINQVWTDVHQAIGPQRAGTVLSNTDSLLTAEEFGVQPEKCAPCAACNEVHLWALWAHESHQTNTALKPCVEAALTNGAALEQLDLAAKAKVAQLVTAAEELTLRAMHS